MNLPRLIIADESRPESVSAGLILVYAMIRAGLRIKVFACARDEAEIRLLRLLLDDQVTLLDPYTQGSIKNIKTLFQRVANPNALNVILTSLGARTAEDYIQITPEVLEISKALSCGVVPVLSASASAILTSNLALSILNTLAEGSETNPVLGIIFSSVKNPREYQLLEQDYGRKTPVLTLGYIPKEIDRPMPALHDLYSSSSNSRTMQIKSAAIQLASTPHQIEWQILEALGASQQNWVPPQTSSFANKGFKVAIIGDEGLSLEGNESAELFNYLGCSTFHYDPWKDSFPNEAEAIYFPHSMGSFYASRLLKNENFSKGIKQSFTANKLIFVNGASSPLFGQSLTLSDGTKQEGLGFFPFSGTYSSLKTSGAIHKVEIRGIFDNLFSHVDEKMRGYSMDYVHISNPGTIIPPLWAYRNIRKDKEHGNSGWLKGYCLVTDLHLELWSCIDLVNRWLSLRKR